LRSAAAHAPLARTFAEREVFFLTRMSSEKTIEIYFALRREIFGKEESL